RISAPSLSLAFSIALLTRVLLALVASRACSPFLLSFSTLVLLGFFACEDMPDCAHRAFGRASIGLEEAERFFSKRRGLLPIEQQPGQLCRERVSAFSARLQLYDRLSSGEVGDYLSEVFGVRANDYRPRARSGFDHVVSAARNQASAYKDYGCVLVDLGKLADRIQKNDV